MENGLTLQQQYTKEKKNKAEEQPKAARLKISSAIRKLQHTDTQQTSFCCPITTCFATESFISSQIDLKNGYLRKKRP